MLICQIDQRKIKAQFSRFGSQRKEKIQGEDQDGIKNKGGEKGSST